METNRQRCEGLGFRGLEFRSLGFSGWSFTQEYQMVKQPFRILTNGLGGSASPVPDGARS